MSCVMTMSNADQTAPPSAKEQESATPGLTESDLQAVAGHAWYVCQTKPRQESLALRKLEEQGYQVYLPLLAVWKKHKDGWQKNDQVMFPRYAFVRCGRTGQSIAPIRSTPGVTGLVSFGNVPACIDDTLVEAIRHLAEENRQTPLQQASPFRIGDCVAVTDGPLKGLSGIISNIAKERVVVMLTLLGREKPVAFPFKQINRENGA
jgi:transcriptional antiterminator RfaH